MTVDSEGLRARSVCRATKVYQWGFSSLLLFLFAIATIISSIILLALNAFVWKQTCTKMLSVDVAVDLWMSRSAATS